MLPESIVTHLQKQFTIQHADTVSGGCINECYKLKTAKGTLFLKYNSADKYPGMFAAEAKGLQLLSGAACMRVPQVIETGNCGDLSYILMEYIERGPAKADTIKNIGRQLAFMHQQTSAYFGLNHPNYIGSLYQVNTEELTWPQFLKNSRLKPMIELGVKKGLLGMGDIEAFEKLFEKLPDLFPEEKPALLHGDLWGG